MQNNNEHHSYLENDQQREKDYLNFFHMLRFWIEQTDNNIANVGKRVRFKEIDENNLDEAEAKYLSPKFLSEYIRYSGFSVRISFFRQGNYKGEAVNFVVWKPDDNDQSWWLNIRYSYNKKCVIAKYKWDVDKNGDSPEFKEYMKASKFVEGLEIPTAELDLAATVPNQKVKELFDYFNEMIDYAKRYKKGGENSMKAQELAAKLEQSYNIILRGAPGTGKTYLAKEIAKQLTGLSSDEIEKSAQYRFVQFHPSYDYTDFVEGLRPETNSGGTVGFSLKKGEFMEFCDNARQNLKEAKQSKQNERTDSEYRKIIFDFLGDITDLDAPSKNDFSLTTGNSFTITDYNESSIVVFIESNAKTNELKVPIAHLINAMKNHEYIKKVKDIVRLDGRTNNYQSDSYVFAILNSIKGNIPKNLDSKIEVEAKKFVFVIDEINRGELSKIFGELFFSIDPDYRGEKGSVTTQYSNLHKDYPEFNDKFFIPSNVYIIGTMNDIDRSVDTFDFAMRRRFTFEEITAIDSQVMLSNPDVIELMDRINNKLISEEIGLSTDYQIGGSYFKALDEGKTNESELWNNKLKPLFKDYLRGERSSNKLQILENAYAGERNNDSING